MPTKLQKARMNDPAFIANVVKIYAGQLNPENAEPNTHPKRNLKNINVI